MKKLLPLSFFFVILQPKDRKKEMGIVNIPLWAWILFYVLVFIMLLIDLKSFGKARGQHL